MELEILPCSWKRGKSDDMGAALMTAILSGYQTVLGASQMSSVIFTPIMQCTVSFYDEKTGSEKQGEMPMVTEGWDSNPVCLILKFIYFSLCYSSFDSLDFHLFLQLNISHG